MTASDKCTNQIKNVLLCRSHPHKSFAAVANSGLVVLTNRGKNRLSINGLERPLSELKFYL